MLTLLEFLIFFIKFFCQKRPILDKCQKNFSVILNKSF
jgi:hypothetical protein